MPSLNRKSVFLLNKYFTGKSMDYKQIIAIIIPIFVDQAFIILMSLLNTAMISSSGVAAVSAVSMVDSLNIFLVNVFVAVATGGTVIVAQYKGSGNQEMVSKAAAQAISAVAILSLSISAFVIVFHTPTLNLLFGNAEAEIFENARIFLIGSCISYPFIAIFQAVSGVLRGVAETKACLGLSLIMNLTYLGLNVLFITVFDMGVIGLVISMISARVLGMVASLVYLLKYNQTLRFKIKNALKLNFSILKKIMFIGLPFAAEQMFFNGGKLLTQTFIVQLGTVAITVNAISGSISLLFQIGGSALSIAVVTVVGQCIGRREIEDARKFIKSFIGLSTVFFVVVTAIIMPLFPFIVRLFSPPEVMIPTIFSLMVLIAIAQPILWSLSFVMPSALRAAGDSKFTSMSSLLSMWLFRVILGYILGITLNLGIMGVWVAMVSEWSIRGFVFAWRFKGDKWYRHKLI
ncbi:putative MATE family efflux protein [Paenibacillus anaericanus]|uniref:Probable multidrug resistance protein NorM n=1 Tax=Paenibacillus anaericanus TaxID=170367 RepID=A0A433Y7F6_9BACL|nr:MATE family efflux transporter [Paenibacillus anaericanus]MDQ0091438.1 putative MATE family efflux protein [Paenibacillus anaericanus]RUT45324.1 MATE family efflux transporter [Paenibacillus anaericanus]